MRIFLVTLTFLLTSAFSLSAQEFNVAFGGEADTSAPIEMSADSLTIDQDTGAAVFDGNVEITQGGMSLTAGFVRVLYSDDTGELITLSASQGVLLTSGPDKADAETAEYDVENSLLKLSGNVRLLQQGAAISAQRMDIDLAKNTASLHGRVRTVLTPRNN